MGGVEVVVVAVGSGAGYQQPQQSGWNSGPSYQQQSSGFVSQPVQAQPTGRPFQPSTAFGQQLVDAAQQQQLQTQVGTVPAGAALVQQQVPGRNNFPPLAMTAAAM